MLKPFFSFYGGKWTLSKYFPSPIHNRIIEPFAGSAGYSTRYPNNEVVLYDVDPVIVSIWKFLVGASRSDILSLPLLPSITDLRCMDLPEGAKGLIGFWISRSRSTPANIPSSWCRSGDHTTSFWSADKRERIANQVQFIRHWKVYKDSYETIPNNTSTWFVDPPYQYMGKHYKHHNIDYSSLAKWCMDRQGQTIVCEGDHANWLPFNSLLHQRTTALGGKRISEEKVWISQ